jgi:hypothetical protein
MPTTMETVLAALAARIAANLPPGAAFARNGTLPTRIPAAGVAILRDGDPGEPEAWLSPPGFYYEHRAELDLIVDRPTAAARDAAFDALKAAVGAALAADRTLGGAVDWAQPEAPVPADIAIDGAEGMKAATVPIVLVYATTDPLL